MASYKKCYGEQQSWGGEGGVENSRVAMRDKEAREGTLR